MIAGLLSHPALYHYLRMGATLGLPMREWARAYGLTDPGTRIADIGCGPCDLLRYVSPQSRPAFYLGLDLSDRYLDSARRRAARAGVHGAFIRIDLQRLPDSENVRRDLLDLLARHDIDRALLLGVLHHIDDRAARTTLDLIHAAPSVRRLITQDVVLIPGHPINNFFCRRDRGRFVRTESGYDALARASAWENHRKFWTHPGLSAIRYIHYEFSRP